MLLKCVCHSCGHSYLADDQVGQLECPRCGVPNDGMRNPSDIPDAPRGVEDEDYYDLPAPDEESFGYGRFDPEAPPPMFVTRERLLRGMVFGVVCAAGLGVALGGALAALSVVVPVVAPALVGLVGGLGARYGFGGRSVRQTRGRAVAAVVIAVLAGVTSFYAGGWLVERFTAQRATVTRNHLEQGLDLLLQRRARVKDEGQRVLLDQRIVEVERLQRRTDPGLEDYLWIQQAQINNPFLAYAKLRTWEGPAVRLGAESDPVDLPEPAQGGIVLVEIVLALFLGIRGVRPR